MQKNYSGLIWDWNGTLIDDVHAALYAVNDMLSKRGKAAITLSQYYAYFDTPISKFYAHLFDLHTVTMDTIAKEFALGYEKYIAEDPIFDGAVEILQSVEEKQIKQIILSSSAQTTVETDVKDYGLHSYFHVISGADNHRAESKVHRANRVIDDVFGHDRNLLVIGDTLHDYQVAQSLGVDCVLFSKGHQSKQDLQQTNTAVIDHLGELQQYIK